MQYCNALLLKVTFPNTGGILKLFQLMKYKGLLLLILGLVYKT